MAATILMDARSIAATIRQNGILTAATELDIDYTNSEYQFNAKLYENQVYDNYEKTNPKHELKMVPNISDWPEMQPFSKHLFLRVAGAYKGSVKTDELIPPGDASSLILLFLTFEVR